MPIIMKSSDNGFVDAINKTVRFPNRTRPPAKAFEEAGRATLNACPLGGWSGSSEAAYLADGRVDMIAGDSGPPVCLMVEAFPHCSSEFIYTETVCANDPARLTESRFRRRFAA